MRKKDKDKGIIRSYKLKHHANPVKEKALVDVLMEYRKASVSIANMHWSLFYKHESCFKDFEDLSSIKTTLSERYKQTCQTKVVGSLKSYLSNVKNRFVQMVWSAKSSIDEQTRIKLFYINKNALWQHNEVFMRKEPIDKETIKLARHIFRHLTKNKPNLSYCNMVLDKKVCEVTSKTENGALTFDYWADISTLNRGNKVNIPLESNHYFDSVGGVFKNVIQANYKNGKLDISLVRQLSPKMTNYCSHQLGIDIGLVVLVATEHGDLLGTRLMERLKNYDEITNKLFANLRKQNIKPKDSPRYQNLIRKVRETIKNEIGRIFNELYKQYSPEKIIVEDLNFKGAILGKRTNRLLHKFGKRIIENKLTSISQVTETKIIKINPAYTSQECPNCHHTHKENRKKRDQFECVECGYKKHADVVGAVNVSGRSSAEFANLNKEKIHQLLSEKHSSWCDNHRRNRPAKDFDEIKLTKTVQRKDLLMLS